MLPWQPCAKFDAHTQYHCQVINNNRYYLRSLPVAMATIVVDSASPKVYGHRYISTAILYLLQLHFFGRHGNIM